jgi:ATP-dependent exoDNAse (exonuclease V) alpha subunit
MEQKLITRLFKMNNIPAKHLSVRVPWHDSEWNGKICCNPRENGSCMFLPRIQDGKDIIKEEQLSSKWMHELDEDYQPPCVGEKVHFMSVHDIYKKVEHPYAKNEGNVEFYGHYRPTTYRYPGYSFSVVPYNWMLKNGKTNLSDKAIELGLAFDTKKEPVLSFENTWVQEISNQKALLDAFIQPIQPANSLVFIYAKNIPYIDTNSRILIGVGHISDIGQLKEYEYDENMPVTFRSTLWERPVYHTIREDFSNGFLLPYHEFFKMVDKDETISIQDYIAFAPSFLEFSFGSEWVSNDTAIESLLILNEKLKKFQDLLPNKNYENQFRWIDREISRLWKMRGPFPGLGSVLSGLKLPEGNLIAWELDTLIRDKKENQVVKNPWHFVELIFKGDISFLSKSRLVRIDETLKATWESFTQAEKQFLELLSRMNLNNDQVNSVINLKAKEQVEYLKNPYLLYETSRLNTINFPVSIIDKAIFADSKILEKFPLSEMTNISTGLDPRRIRGLVVDVLERHVIEGHTLLTDTQLVTKLHEQPFQPLCNPSLRNLIAIETVLKTEVIRLILDEEKELYYFKLQRLNEFKNTINNFVQKRIKRNINPPIDQDWLKLIENKFGLVDSTKPEWYQERDREARQEKANALKVISNSRISVLLGPAGTGKTTLLNLLCQQPFISNGTILRLAPTGKARVNMGRHAQTLAQFLFNLGRYDSETGRYVLNPTQEQAKYDTVIVDEASMLTEEQLAALIESLTGVERFILVGDYRQLPPIGAGRPFVDIIEYLERENKGIAELKVLFRQFSQKDIPDERIDRIDVRLSKWFSDDEIKKMEINIFREIAKHPTKQWNNIRFIEWDNTRHLEEILIDVIDYEIEQLLKSQGKPVRNSQANFDASLGANFYMERSNWSGFGIESAKEIENWQIISPIRTSGYGTKVINQRIQKIFRGKIKEKAIFPGKYLNNRTQQMWNYPRKQPRPLGEDGLVYGDKVINTKNTQWKQPWNYILNPSKISNDDILRYFANGEIGLHIGAYGEWISEKKGYKRPVYIAFSSQPGYAYTFRESDFKEDGDMQMELAYSITVHKSQGSGFGVVFFILPNPCPILSRELFYTALTRQEDRIVILHQGSFKDYEKFTTGEYSETGRRLTDLFFPPSLKLVNKKFYDTKYIQISEKGEFMISKSEVIIADKLFHNNIQYVYEAPITDSRGITIHPDFTIEDSDTGIIYYWEHLGMLTKDDYRSKWKLKQEWYAINSISEFTIDPNSDRQLIITRDKPDGGIDSSELKFLIDKLFK